jgi:hypothetical protein
MNYSEIEENLKKQKHTAKRIYERLVSERQFKGAEVTVRMAVKRLKADKAVPPQSLVPLSYSPGEAIQIDWGEATAYISGKKIKVNLFCMRECYSVRTV